MASNTPKFYPDLMRMVVGTDENDREVTVSVFTRGESYITKWYLELEARNIKKDCLKNWSPPFGPPARAEKVQRQKIVDAFVEHFKLDPPAKKGKEDENSAKQTPIGTQQPSSPLALASLRSQRSDTDIRAIASESDSTMRSSVETTQEIVMKLEGLIKNLRHTCKVACLLLGANSFDEVVPPKDFSTLVKDFHCMGRDQAIRELIKVSTWDLWCVVDMMRPVLVQCHTMLREAAKLHPLSESFAEGALPADWCSAREGLEDWMTTWMEQAREVFGKMSQLRGEAQFIIQEWEKDGDILTEEAYIKLWNQMGDDQRIEELRTNINKIMDRSARNPNFDKALYGFHMRRQRALVRLGPIDGFRKDWECFQEVHGLLGEAVGDPMTQWDDDEESND